jgi:hypothetical protein
LLRERDIVVSVATVWSFYDRCGISFKKSLRDRADRPDVAMAAWVMVARSMAGKIDYGGRSRRGTTSSTSRSV